MLGCAHVLDIRTIRIRTLTTLRTLWTMTLCIIINFIAPIKGALGCTQPSAVAINRQQFYLDYAYCLL